MITSIAAFLQELKDIEAAKLSEEKVTHGPTIGAMYEGLTRDILDRAIPPELNLQIVDGFIEGVSGRLSTQIDAMLVTGEGRKIPHTDGYVWPMQDVIAVLEVKKNLFGADLEDGFNKLRTVMDMHDELIKSKETYDPSILPACNAFALLTGKSPRTKDDIDALSKDLLFIFRYLVSEQLAPVRILIGYEGYTDEYSLRMGLIKHLEKNVKTGVGFGVGSLPNLIICKNNALLKVNGQPYVSPLNDDGWWPVVVSNGENPLTILVELIWTRLSNQFQAQFPVDDTLKMERLIPLLDARFGKVGELYGWEYSSSEISRKQLSTIEPTSWEPRDADENEWVVLHQVARAGEFDVRDKDFRQLAADEGFDPDAIISGLIKNRHLAWCDDHTVRLTTTENLITVFTPDGRMVAADDGDADLLKLWLLEQLEKKHPRG